MAYLECPECKNKLAPTDVKCGVCGAEVSVCPKCNAVEAGSPDICKNCGADLERLKQKSTKKPPRRLKGMIGERPVEECDLVRCIRDVEDTNAFYMVLKVLRSVTLVFFWIISTFVCISVFAAAFVAAIVYGVSQSASFEVANEVFSVVMVFFNVLAVGSVLPILLFLFYRACIYIPFDFFGTLISGICARKYAFGRDVTVSVFKDPSLVMGIDDAYARALTIYPFLIGKSRGKVGGILLDLAVYAYKLAVPLLLIFVYGGYILTVVASVILSRFIIGFPVLPISLLVGVLALLVLLILTFAVRTILDIVSNSVREYFIGKWDADLREGN